MSTLKSSNHDGLIMSVEEARKILGHTYDKYSDEHIKEIIINLDELAAAYFKSVQ